jgi:hypothetical protein
MPTFALLLALVLVIAPLSLGCRAPTQAALPTAAPDVCGDGRPVARSDVAQAGSAFVTLERTTTAPLRFSCATDAPCRLPSDATVEVSARFLEQVACEFAACRAPHAFAGLPLESGDQDPCAPVLWAPAELHLRTSEGTVDLSSQPAAAHVNVIARSRGDGYLRFIVESPSSMQQWLAPDQPRAVLLDVQLELTGTRMRGQMSALAAPLPAEPAAELRFTSLWSATWEAATALQGR